MCVSVYVIYMLYDRTHAFAIVVVCVAWRLLIANMCAQCIRCDRKRNRSKVSVTSHGRDLYMIYAVFCVANKRLLPFFVVGLCLWSNIY